MSNTTVVTREHEFCYGHRVVGHEGKCKHLHGHNAKVEFMVAPITGLGLDVVGRVVDFSVIKEKLCQWLEDNWDHKMILSENDPIGDRLSSIISDADVQPEDMTSYGLVFVPFNPTAENMAEYLLNTVGPKVFEGTNVQLVSVRFWETSKCSAIVHKGVW